MLLAGLLYLGSGVGLIGARLHVAATDATFIAGSKGLVAGVVNTLLAIAIGAQGPAASAAGAAMLVGFFGYGAGRDMIDAVVAGTALGEDVDETFAAAHVDAPALVVDEHVVGVAADGNVGDCDAIGRVEGDELRRFAKHGENALPCCIDRERKVRGRRKFPDAVCVPAARSSTAICFASGTLT